MNPRLITPASQEPDPAWLCVLRELVFAAFLGVIPILLLCLYAYCTRPPSVQSPASHQHVSTVAGGSVGRVLETK